MSNIVRDYYNANAEAERNRLDLPLCRVEFASALRLIDKYFPKSGSVCDIGGATGRYTLELLRRGYAVTLLDLSAEEIRLAELELQKNSLCADQLIVGDAADMSMLPPASFDAALMMGPMYHIVEPEARAKALSELHRVLRPQGIALIAYLNTWGVLKTLITDSPDEFQDISLMRSLLSKQALGAHTASSFTEIYLSTPVAALREVQDAGFEIVSYAGAESFANGLGLQMKQVMLEQPEAYRNIVTLAAESSELEQYRDSTDHLHLVARAVKLDR